MSYRLGLNPQVTLILTILTFIISSQITPQWDLQECTIIAGNPIPNEKALLCDEIDKYIDSIAPEADINSINLIDLCDKYNVDLIFVLAQGQLESHFGTRGIASKTHSIFNVNAYDGLTAQQVYNINHYDNPDDSIEPYLQLLKKYYLQGQSTTDLMNNYINNDGKRYASNKRYERDLTSIYNSIIQNTAIQQAYQNYQKIKS